MKSQYYQSQIQKEGYNIAHDLLTAAKTISKLTDAVIKAMKIIKEYKIDEFNAKRLEDYGKKRLDSILLYERKIEWERSHNRKIN